MSNDANDGRIVNAICQLRPGEWDASEGEVVDGILVMRPTTRRRLCCDRPLELVVEAGDGPRTWGLWRCRRCERTYSFGPKLPATWVGVLARACIGLYEEFQAKVAEAYGSSGHR